MLLHNYEHRLQKKSGMSVHWLCSNEASWSFFFCPWALSGFTQLKTIIDLLRISAQCVLLWQWLNSTCSSITRVAGPHTHMLTRHINSFIICWKCVDHTHRVVCHQYLLSSHQMCFLFRSEPLCDACFAHHRSKKYKSECEKSEPSLNCFVPCCTAFIAFLCREWIKKKVYSASSSVNITQQPSFSELAVCTLQSHCSPLD